MNDNKPQHPLMARLQGARERYAQEWGGGNAAKFASEGYYAWMAGFLQDCGTVLEVGVGNGSSTRALLDAGLTVIGLDENPACLEAARDNLGDQYPDIALELRGELGAAASGYAISYRAPRAAFPRSGCLLLEGDIMNDAGLLEWVRGNGGVDAIVCWLMGTYQERAFNTTVMQTGARSPSAYRSAVQAQVCSVADRLLAKDGLLHIVDRCLLVPNEQGDLPGSPAWMAQCEQAYRAQAGTAALGIDDIEFLRYLEPESSQGPAVKLTRSLSGANPEASEKSFVSVLMRHT